MRKWRPRHFPRLIFVVLGLCTLLLLTTLPTSITHEPAARANAFVIGSDPIDGSTISAPPVVIRIYFNAPIGAASVARVYAFAPNQVEVDFGRSVIPSANPRELDTYLVPASQLPQGGYEVQWTALDSIDGHTTHGLIGFNLGHSTTGLSGVPLLGPSTSNCLPQLLGGQSEYCAPPINTLGLLSVIWEWLVTMALTFWVGILTVEGIILANIASPALQHKRIREQARSLQSLCLSALLVGEVVSLALRDTQLSQYVRNSGFDIAILIQLLFSTIYGYLWLARIALLIMAIAFLKWAASPRRGWADAEREPSWSTLPGGQGRAEGSRDPTPSKNPPASSSPHFFIGKPQRYQLIPLLLAALILLTLALTGDFAQQAQPHISAIIFDWLYLLARSILLGSFAYLGYVLLPPLPVSEPDAYVATLIHLLQRFLPAILAAIAVLLVTGLFLAEASLGSIQQLFNHPFGQAMFAQYLLLALILLLSAYILFVLRTQFVRHEILLPITDTSLPVRHARQAALSQSMRKLRRSLHTLSWLGAAALLCSALMAFYAPPILFPPLNLSQGNSTPAPTTQNIQTKQVNNLIITLQVLPNRIASPHTVLVTLSDSSGHLISNAQVQMAINMQIMDMGTTSANLKSGAPLYVATFPQNATFSMIGLWNITLTIHQPGQIPFQVIFPVDLQGS